MDPTHLRDLRVAAQAQMEAMDGQSRQGNEEGAEGWVRARRIRDAVEAALAGIILLGTEEHYRLASQAASDMTAGRPIHTAELVVSLRNFIRAGAGGDPVPSFGQRRADGPAFDPKDSDPLL